MSAGAPDEMVEAVRYWLKSELGYNNGETASIADVVLSVPALAEVIARDAKVREIVAAGRFPGGVSISATEALRIAALYPEAGK